MPGLNSQAPCDGCLVPVPALRGGEIAIGQALLENGLGHLAVQRQAFRLAVFLVPAQVQPAQTLENRLQRGFGITLHVGVVHAQNQVPP